MDLRPNLSPVESPQCFPRRGRLRDSVLIIFSAAVFFSAAVSIAGEPNAQVPIVEEAVSTLSRYLRVNTSNPPGNEIGAARFWKEFFDREGIPCEIILPAPGSKRANVVARLAGNGKGKSVVLLNHLDVVPAGSRHWSRPPFSGEISDGAVWGRGATDMKGTAVAQAYVLTDLSRRGVHPQRDLIFLGTADEESGRENGAAWILQQRPEIVAGAELLLTEGAPARQNDSSQVESFSIVATEKSPLWLRITASGLAGHASIPDPASAPDRLLRALCSLQEFRPDFVVTPVARRYFAQLAEMEPERLGPLFRDLDAALANPAFRQRLASDPGLSAMVKNTCQVTRLAGGEKINVVPAESSAELDCRLLPGESPQVFLSRLKIASGDPDLVWDVLSSYSANDSPLDTELVRTVERIVSKRAPKARVLTPVLTASNDAHLFRDAGIMSYGFDPFPLGDDDERAHGDDERMPISSFRFGFELYLAVVESYATNRALGDTVGARR